MFGCMYIDVRQWVLQIVVRTHVLVYGHNLVHDAVVCKHAGVVVYCGFASVAFWLAASYSVVGSV